MAAPPTLTSFPKRKDENWLKHILCWLSEEEHVRPDYRPVRLEPMSNDVSMIPPKERAD
jgi:succinate dehydrogenase / fumarate reductase flavoprotein subunit